MTAKIPTYTSKGVKICQSQQHADMFILNYVDGSFCTIYASVQQIKQMHPPDFVNIFKEQFGAFKRTFGNYTPPTGASKPKMIRPTSAVLERNHLKQRLHW